MAASLEFATDRTALRKRELLFMFALSVAFHVSIVALLVTSPFSLSRTPVALLPAVITVDLVAAPAAARPAPAPVPEPVKIAEPAKPRPGPKKTVLPKEARLDPEKAKPKPKPRREPELAPDPKPVVQKKYADVMAQLRAEAGEVAPEPVVVAKRQPEPSARGSSGVGRLVSPEVARWIRRTKSHIKPNWVIAPGFRTQDLETHVLVNLDSQGVVRGDPKITRPSGNPWYDEGVVRAIIKSSPLPPPPAADRWPFVFVPGDSY